MNKLSVLLTIIVSLGVLSCGNIMGNQSDDKNIATQENSDKIKSDAEPEYLTLETFKEKVWDFENNPTEWVYKGDVPCIIDFYADWCKPCKMVAPIMDSLAKEYNGRVKIYKVDTQKERELAGAFGIRSIPTVLFSPMEGRPSMSQGALPKAEYIRIIEENLLNDNNN